MRNSKLVKPILIVCLLFFIVCAALCIREFVKYSDYVKVEAEVIAVETRDGRHNSTSSNKSYFVTYEYEVDSEFHTATKQVFTKVGKSVGDIQEIRYNPENHSEIENTLKGDTYIALAVFLGIVVAFLGILLAKNKKN